MQTDEKTAREKKARDVLAGILDPELGVNLVDLGLVYGIDVTETSLHVRMTMTSNACPLGNHLAREAAGSLRRAFPEIPDVQVRLVWSPPWSPDRMSESARKSLGRTRAGAPPGRSSISPAAVPILIGAMLCLVGGVLGGLARLGWDVPRLPPPFILDHGLFMVGGFLGAVISIERSVAAGGGVALAVPAGFFAGALALLGMGAPLGFGLFALSSAGLSLLLARFAYRQPSLPSCLLFLGGASFLVGNLKGFLGAATADSVPWFISFLTLTISAERLELSRLMRASRASEGVLAALLAMFLAGAVGDFRLSGLALIAISAWLFFHDPARKLVLTGGLPRFTAVNVLIGNAWLAVAGALIAISAQSPSDFRYDAFLHAFFLGYVFSMIFAHAPIILPAVAGIALPLRKSFYAHVFLLSTSLAARMVADLTETGALQRESGLVNAAALALFLFLTLKTGVAEILRGRRQPPT